MRIISNPTDIHGIGRRRQRLNRHFISCERAGFIRTNNRHRAKSFNSRQPANNRMTSCHRLNANGQRDGHDCRQPLGNGGDGQSHARKKHVTDRIFSKNNSE